MEKSATRYFCQTDGAQWNVPVEVVHSFEQLHVVRGLTSDLIGYPGSDGHVYALVPECELFDKQQS